MKSREISRSKIEPFSLACTDPYIGIGWEYLSSMSLAQLKPVQQRYVASSKTTVLPTEQSGRTFLPVHV